MTTMVLRELVVLGRRPALAAAAAVMVGLAAGFVIAWPSGIPAGTSGTLFSQLQVVREALAAVVIPWVICRCGSGERGNDLVTLSMLSGLSPSRILAARVFATLAAVGVLLLAALPVDLLAQQAIGADAVTLAKAEMRVLLIGSYAGAIALACEHLVSACLWRWLVATIVTLAAFVLIRTLDTGDTLLVSIVLIAGGWLSTLVVRADRRWQYVDEAIA